MWSRKAVCVSCGAYKKRRLGRCSQCGFEPSTDYEKARALILSEHFSVGPATIGRSAPQLEQIAKEIRRGRPYLFDSNEEQAGLKVYRYLHEVARLTRLRNRIIWVGVSLLIALLLFFSL